MDKKYLILLVAVVSVLTSCNDKKETANEEDVNVKKFFNVEVEAIASKSDDFAMYFSEDGTSKFEDINAKWAGIKGGSQSQKVVFELTEDRVPTHFRLDFGLKNQDSVVVKNIKVSYYKGTYEVKGSDFFNYFIKDDQFVTKVDPAKGTLTILPKDGVYKTPYYYPTQLTIDKVKEITTSK